MIKYLLILAVAAGTIMPLNAGREKEAAEYLNEAVADYQNGRDDKAFFHLAIAGDVDRAFIMASADAYRLRAFLYLSAGRRSEAMAELVKSLKIRPDAFLFYLLGSYNLGLRSFEQARNAFQSAAQNHPPGVSAGRTLREIVPFACPGDNDLPLEEIRKDPFRNPDMFSRIWEQKLSEEEYALSAFLSFSISRKLNDQAEAQSSRSLLAQYASRAVFVFERLGNLLKNPDADEAHNICIRNLEQMENRERNVIDRGSLDPSAHNLELIVEFLRRNYWIRSALFGDVRSYFAYGTFLLRNRKYLEALYVLRKTLELSAAAPADADVSVSYFELSQIYRQLESAYSGLGRASDAVTVGSFALLYEQFESYAAKSGVDQASRRLSAGLRLKAGENLANREALSYLIRQYRSDPEKFRNYSRRLMERDRVWEDAELSAAFGGL